MKEKNYVLGIWLFVFVIILIMFLPIITHNNNSDKECLEDIARDYCNKSGYEYEGITERGNLYIDKSFNCLDKNSERLSSYKLQKTFYFLESEKEQCKNGKN
jgi:hypothetical protein